jgi:hypothetical protein
VVEGEEVKMGGDQARRRVWCVRGVRGKGTELAQKQATEEGTEYGDTEGLAGQSNPPGWLLCIRWREW